MFVLDCSMTMAWLFEDEKNEHSEKILDRLNDETTIVPSLWILEVMNTLKVAEKRKRITISESVHFFETLKSLPIEIDEGFSYNRVDSILFIARSYTLSSYDAAYLDLALRFEIPLATLDKDLIKGAKKLGIKVLE